MTTFAKPENARAKGNIFCNYYVALVMVRDNLRKLCFFRPVIRMIKIVQNIDNNKIVSIWHQHEVYMAFELPNEFDIVKKYCIR